MDHDSVPLDLPGPASHKIADVREAYAKITRHGLDVMGEKIAHDAPYRSNESGHFAWDVSLLIRAACQAWRATGDPLHLQQAVTWAQHVMERTDEALGVVNWRGRSGPVWSAGPRYTAGTTTLGTIGGVPIHAQGAADSLLLERPSATTARLHAKREGQTVWSLPEASLLPDEASYLPDLLALRSSVHSVLIRGLPSPIDLTSLRAGEFPLEPQFAAHIVHTGMIARALIAAAEELESAERGTISAETTPDDLFSAAERALLCHDDEIRTRSGQSWYITPEDFPGRRLGLELPHNHVVDAATSFLIIGRRKGNKGLRNLGASLTRRFLREVDAYDSGVIRHPWYYYPVDSDIFFGVTRENPMVEREIRAVTRGEDSSHATMRVRALTEWKAIDDRLVSDKTLSSVALSFRRFFMANKNGVATLKWLPEDDKREPTLGRSNTFAGAWGSLAPWDSSIKRRINSMAYRHPPKTIFGATVLSAAEIVAMNVNPATYASSGRTAQE
jgi:hypothetical protein